MSRWQWIFAIAAAVIAAATVDPIVERLSNAGFFGPGSYTDHSNGDVLPALCAGALCSIAFVILAAVRSLGFANALSQWLERPAREFDGLRVRALLGRIYALQIAVLFVMETAEQKIVLGHFLGGAVWLGGPVLASLALHFVGCIVVSLLLSRFLQLLARRVVAVVRAIWSTFMPIGVARTRFVRPREPELACLFAPLLERPTVRPPPLLFA